MEAYLKHGRSYVGIVMNRQIFLKNLFLSWEQSKSELCKKKKISPN